MRLFNSQRISKIMDTMGLKEGEASSTAWSRRA